MFDVTVVNFEGFRYYQKVMQMSYFFRKFQRMELALFCKPFWFFLTRQM